MVIPIMSLPAVTFCALVCTTKKPLYTLNTCKTKPLQYPKGNGGLYIYCPSHLLCKKGNCIFFSGSGKFKIYLQQVWRWSTVLYSLSRLSTISQVCLLFQEFPELVSVNSVELVKSIVWQVEQYWEGCGAKFKISCTINWTCPFFTASRVKKGIFLCLDFCFQCWALQELSTWGHCVMCACACVQSKGHCICKGNGRFCHLLWVLHQKWCILSNFCCTAAPHFPHISTNKSALYEWKIRL